MEDKVNINDQSNVELIYGLMVQDLKSSGLNDQRIQEIISECAKERRGVGIEDKTLLPKEFICLNLKSLYFLFNNIGKDIFNAFDNIELIYGFIYKDLQAKGVSLEDIEIISADCYDERMSTGADDNTLCVKEFSCLSKSSMAIILSRIGEPVED